MQLIHVHGPMKTGKTLNREVIADYFNCDMIVDDGKIVQHGSHKALVLCRTAPDEETPSDGTFRIDEARKYILNHPGYCGRWIDPSTADAVKRSLDGVDLSNLFADLPRSLLFASPPLKFHAKAHLEETAVKSADPEEKPRFDVGAVVRLKSCVKPMTVVSDRCGNTYDVMWFDGTELKEESFHADCLAPSEPDIDHRFDIPW